MASLRVQKGQKIRADHHNGLVDLAESVTIQQGRLKGRREPDGFLPRFDVKAVAVIGYAFKLTFGEGDDDELLVSLTPAHVSGVMPTIGDEGLDELDEAGNPPSLRIGKAAWAKRGLGERALVMFRYELDRMDFTVAKVAVVAVPTVPQRAPFTWHKLVAILVRQDGQVRVFPQVFFPQEFLAVDTTAAGTFRPLPFAAP